MRGRCRARPRTAMADTATETLEIEERRRTPALVAAVGGFIFIFAGQALQASGADGADSDAEQLTERTDAFNNLLAGSIVMLIGFVGLAFALNYVYQAAARRSSTMRGTFAPMLPLGAILIGISGILLVFAFDQIAEDFLAGTPITGDAGEDRAEDLITDSNLYEAASFIGIAGLFAFAVGIFYTALNAMRTGLLTRFIGTLGMALSVIVLISQIGIIGILMWTVVVVLIAAGRWPGGRPPAWEAGVAIPWLKPGEQPADVPDREEEPARPEDFEGTATEVESERPGRRDNKRKRKRKQRG